MKRLVLLTALFSAFALGAAAAAGASVTLGQTCPTNTTGPTGMFQRAVAAGASYTVPADGVLTSWGTDRSGTTNYGIIAAALATPSGSNWSVDSVLPFQYAPPSTASTFPARAVVKAGQSLGYVVAGSQPLICSTGNSGDTAAATGVMTAGTNFVDNPVAQYRADITAVIEPDADQDGYGDETQDKCPQSAAFQDACPTLAISQQLSATSKKINVLATASVATSLTATATIKLSKRKTVTVKGKPTAFAAGQLKTIRLSLPSSVRKALKRVSLKATVKLTGNGLANTATATSKVTLKKK